MSQRAFQFLLGITSTVMVFAPPVMADKWAPSPGPHTQGTAGSGSDNTQLNIRDRSEQALTADKQGTSERDTELTRQIRREIVGDKSLSTYAHNIKIITRDGKVTLRGPVRSSQEKQTLERKAISIAGAGNVNSDIGIAK